MADPDPILNAQAIPKVTLRRGSGVQSWSPRVVPTRVTDRAALTAKDRESSKMRFLGPDKHWPITKPDGSLDENHLRAVLSMADRTHGVSDAAKAHAKAEARRLLDEHFGGDSK